MVFEGDWVQEGDLLADAASSQAGELSLGQNLLIAYMPWEGYNYEDAILISERLVCEDLYTSIHIESYETETRKTKYGFEEITNRIPDISQKEISYLDNRGIIRIGTFVQEGTILVGKTTPIQKKFKSPYQKLLYTILEKELESFKDSSLRAPKGLKAKVIDIKILKKNLLKKPEYVKIYLAEKRKIQVGDKMAGRHGNKGIVSQILPRQDMPYLPDGTPLDMVLNPLGVPSRMNVGQIYECLLGFAAKYLKEYFRITPFDEIYGAQASRSFVFSKLYEARLKTKKKWIFNPIYPGKMKLFDGRTGEPFDQAVTVGISYMLKLVHLVDDKIHCLTPDHDVLTTNGWIPIDKVTTTHKVATLERSTGQLVYQNPLSVFNYPQYNGDLYHIKNSNIDLLVTLNHRMLVKKGKNYDQYFADYQLIEAKNIFGKHYKYLKNANWMNNDYQFTLPAIVSNSLHVLRILSSFSSTCLLASAPSPPFCASAEPSHRLCRSEQNLRLSKGGDEAFASATPKRATSTIDEAVFASLGEVEEAEVKERKVNMDDWLMFFGLWISEGWVTTTEITEKLEKLENTSKNSSNLLVNSDNFSVDSSNSSEDLNKNATFLKKLKQKAVYQVQICLAKQHKEQVIDVLAKAIRSLGYAYRIVDNKLTIHDKQLWTYLRPLSVDAPNKFFPSWVWELSQTQAQKLLHALFLGNGALRTTSVSYYTSSVKLADDVMRLALHAGWSANKYLHNPKCFKSTINGCKVISNNDLYRISIVKSQNNPAVNHGLSFFASSTSSLAPFCTSSSSAPFDNLRLLKTRDIVDFTPRRKEAMKPALRFIAGGDEAGRNLQLSKTHERSEKRKSKKQNVQIEEILPSYQGSVHCLSVPNEVFYVRRNGLTVWTGNSRSTGPYSLVTQQPLRGRSKYGGQRLGEMEVWALEGYGAAFTLLEMLTIKSDDITGRMTLWSNILLHKEIYIGTPESFKVLVCELQALCLDIGLYRLNPAGFFKKVENLIRLP
jgi:hypothetical protein